MKKTIEWRVTIFNFTKTVSFHSMYRFCWPWRPPVASLLVVEGGDSEKKKDQHVAMVKTNMPLGRSAGGHRENEQCAEATRFCSERRNFRRCYFFLQCCSFD